MRYDKPITFFKQTEGYYDFDLGEHVPGQIVTNKVMANVTDLGTEKSIAAFGSIKEGAKVIRLLKRHVKLFDYVTVDGKTYDLLREQSLRRKQTLIVQEVIR